MSRLARAFVTVAVGLSFRAAPAVGQVGPTTIEVTRDAMIELRMNSSYQVRTLNMSMEQSRLQLVASNAALRSSADLSLRIPSFRAVADNRYNSSLGQWVTVHTERREWEAELSIRQPVVIPFIGYPTNGYLTFTTSLFTRTQPVGDSTVTDFAREYNLRYTQPLFQPNQLKNNLERAELDFESQAMNNEGQLRGVASQAENDYFALFRSEYEQTISEEYIQNLEQAERIAAALSETVPAKAIELRQVQVELSNARQELERQRSDFRTRVANLSRELGLPAGTEFALDPQIEVDPVTVDPAEVTALVMERSRRLRSLAITQRRNELSFNQTKGQSGMRVNLEFSFGREVRNALRFGDLWVTPPDNTYTVSITAAIPIWDWGERDARIENARINIVRTQLQIDEAQASVLSQVQNEVRNVEERQARAIALQNTAALSRETSREALQLYESGTIGLQELLQSLVRQRDTSQSLLEAYLGWEQSRRSLDDMIAGGTGFGGGGGGGPQGFGGGGGGRGGGPPF